MKFCVCIKQVPDVAAHVQTGRMVLNAYDASAVEAALQLTEAHGGTVHLVLAGPDAAKETIRKALAMGADEATHLVTASDMDSYAVSSLLAEHFEDGDYDVILTGKQSQDTDAGLAGSMLAEHLGRVYATNAVGLAVEGENILLVTRQGDAGQEIIALPTPCLVTCSNDMNDPRIPSLKGIMASKKKPLNVQAVTPGPGRSELHDTQAPPERKPGIRIDGEPAEQASHLVHLLQDEAGVL